MFICFYVSSCSSPGAIHAMTSGLYTEWFLYVDVDVDMISLYVSVVWLYDFLSWWYSNALIFRLVERLFICLFVLFLSFAYFVG